MIIAFDVLLPFTSIDDKPCPTAPVISLHGLWERLHHNRLGDRTLCSLQQDSECPKAEFNILTQIKKQAEKNSVVTSTDIRHYCREVYKFEASRREVDSFVSRHPGELTEKKSSLQKEAR
jgi:hypothetical protein